MCFIFKFVIYLIKWQTQLSSSSASRNTYFSLETTMLIFIVAYMPGTILCALHISTLSILTKGSGSQPQVIRPVLHLREHMAVSRDIFACYNWRVATGIQQAAGKYIAKHPTMNSCQHYCHLGLDNSVSNPKWQ